MEVTIREARPQDFESVLELVLELRRHFKNEKPLDRERSLATYDRFTSGADHYVYVAEAEGRIVGMMTLSVLVSLFEDRPYIVVDELITAADCRGRGIGRRLLDEAFARAVERGCCEVCLDTDESNEAALRFYREYGFDRESVLLEKELE